MKIETTMVPRPDETMSEVWKLKEENAAAHDFDMDAIAAAARKNQKAHSHRIVSRHAADAEQADAPNGIPAP